MNKDPIVEEVRRVRQTNAARFNYDIEAIVRDLRRRERKQGHKVVSMPPKRPASRH